MAEFFTTVTFQHVSGLTEDVSINTFACRTTDSGPTQVTLFGGLLNDYYQSVGPWLSPRLSRTVLPRYRAYNIADPEPRHPYVEEDLQALPPPNADDSLPAEVAVCMSFQSVLASGSPAARRRGRIYLGPLTTAAMAQSSGQARVANAFAATIAEAGETLMQQAYDAEFDWCVWSRTNSTLYAVRSGWVDNEFDTQRRRGVRATSRQTWVLTA